MPAGVAVAVPVGVGVRGCWTCFALARTAGVVDRLNFRSRQSAIKDFNLVNLPLPEIPVGWASDCY